MAQRDPKTGRFLKKGETTKTTGKAKVAKKATPAPKKAKKAAEPKPKAKKVEKPKVVKTTKPKVEKAAKEISEKIQKVLESPLKVFIKKDITGESKNIGPGSSVIFEKLAAIGPTGSHVVRVKRENSDRTYYTTEENLPQ